MRRYARDLKDIADLYNIKSGSDTSKKGEGLKILTNKQMLNRLPVLLAQIQAGNNSKSLKNEVRQILYSLYRSKVLTKTVADKYSKNIPRLENVEVVLVHCNLVNNSYQQHSRVLFTFVSAKQYGQLISMSPHSLVFLKTMNTDFSEIEIWFTDQNNKALEIEDNVNISLIINTS